MPALQHPALVSSILIFYFIVKIVFKPNRQETHINGTFENIRLQQKVSLRSYPVTCLPKSHNKVNQALNIGLQEECCRSRFLLNVGVLKPFPEAVEEVLHEWKSSAILAQN